MQSLLDETLEDSSTAFANYESDEIYERVLGAINKLPTDLRKVIQMRYFEKLSYAEIAQRLSISESTARVRCFRALRMLRDWLTDN
jgi:RNA polymerase sigma-70 factor (ECF subfamily)